MSEVLELALASVVAAGFVVVSLVGLLVIAKEKLVPSGEVRVVINDDDDNALKAQPGSTGG